MSIIILPYLLFPGEENIMLKVKEIMEALKSFDQEAYVDINLSLSEKYNKGDKLYYVATPEEEGLLRRFMDSHQ